MKLAVVCLAGLIAACAGEGGNVREGRFSFAWQLEDNGTPVDCATAGVAKVRIVTDNGVVTTEEFVCSDGQATTAVRDAGTYTVTVSAVDLADVAVATSTDTGTIVGGQITELDVFPLELSAEVCDASSCPTGCCDDTGTCVDPQADTACGIGGVACVDCANLGQVCNTTEGTCID